MARFHLHPLALLISAWALLSTFANGTFTESTLFAWGGQHSAILGTGDDLQLVLDQTAGSAVQSKGKFHFGSFEMLIKLAPGNTAGTVTAFYLSSSGNKHNEIDFEFLGNVTGQPYTIHTNIFTQGIPGKEQQFYPWFDPTDDYHNYTILWNPNVVIWYIDGIPIRIFRNYQSQGIGYPGEQGMHAYSSIWNAEFWATRGGLDKVDWDSAPFIARFRNFRPRACNWDGAHSMNRCAAPSNRKWWNSPDYSQLSKTELDQLLWVRKNYMIYDYCLDPERFNGYLPGECYQPQFEQAPES